MAEVKRTRSRPVQDPTRLRRVRPSGTGMDITVPPAASELSGYAGGETVEIVMRISAEVTEGNMHRGELENWFRAAMHSYHTFRNGFVGMNANAKIRVPRCVRIDKLADSVE